MTKKTSKTIRKNKAMKQEICYTLQPKNVQEFFRHTQSCPIKEEKNFYFLLNTCDYIKFWKNLINRFCEIFVIFVLNVQFTSLKTKYELSFKIQSLLLDFKCLSTGKIQKDLMDRLRVNFNNVNSGTKMTHFRHFQHS